MPDNPPAAAAAQPRASRRRALRILAGLPVLTAMTTPRAKPSAPAPLGMLARQVPASGEAIPVIGLGTWQTFDVGGDAQARARLATVLGEFAARGGRLIDSSPMYGSSESVVGDLAAEQRLHARLFMATKVWTRGRDDGVRQMETSMRRLRVERIDLMQVHNLLDVDTHAKTLRAWKDAGRVRYTGITHYAASAHAEVERVLKAAPWDFVQINYSLAEPQAAERLLPLAAERRVAVIVNRPFAEGGMFARVRGRPLPGFAAELGATSWAQLFLKWILGHDAVTCVIPATSKLAHLRDNLGAAAGGLPDARMRRRIEDAFRSA